MCWSHDYKRRKKFVFSFFIKNFNIMAKVRLYRVGCETKSSKDGYVLVTAKNKDAAKIKARKIGVRGASNPKFT